MSTLILAAALLGQCQNGTCQPQQYQPQIVQIPQKVGEQRSRITYPTPLRDFFFGSEKVVPIYKYQQYRLVVPQPQQMYYQPSPYYVPYRRR